MKKAFTYVIAIVILSFGIFIFFSFFPKDKVITRTKEVFRDTSSYANQSYTSGDLADPVCSIGSLSSSGDVQLTKTVSTVDKTKGIYNVKFKISSINAITTVETVNPVYVVVVFDTSLSMCEIGQDNCGDKWGNATSGAIEFSSKLLENVKDANIALVNFADDILTTGEFYNRELVSTDFRLPNGGTNITLGLQKAEEMLNNVTEKNAKKIIVLISDGNKDESTNFVTKYLEMIKTIVTVKDIKESSIELFTVLYDITKSNANFFRAITTSTNSKYYIDSKTNEIKTKLNNMVKEISMFSAGSNVVITDIIGDNFTYVENSKSEGVKVDGNTVTYKIDKLKEKETFEFNIAINEKSNTGWHMTNNNATISYVDSKGSSIKKTIGESSKVYWVAPKYEYTINYYKDEISEENLIGSTNKEDDYNKEITVDTNYKIPEGYTYDREELKYIIKEKDNIINVIYTKKSNLTYCVNYFYDGIIDINNTICYYNEPHGKEITSFIDKPREGYVFDSFDPITVLDKEENILNVYYKKLAPGEIIPPKTGL